MRLKNFLLTVFFVILSALILVLSIRGLPGNPTPVQLNTIQWKDNGPFELSPERGRFALTYSLVENKSLQFSDDIGEFAKPDVAVYKGNYVSLFAPLVSFITAPGYFIGKYFGFAQVGTFAVISFFAVFNFLLIRKIAIKLGANQIAASLAALAFLFATPAFTYAVDLYQHHISTFLILSSLYLLIQFDSFWSLGLVFLLCAVSIPLDNPNLVLMFPIGAYALTKIFSLKDGVHHLKISLKPWRILAPVLMTIPIAFFLWFNLASNGNPFQLSGTLPSPRSISASVSHNPNNLVTDQNSKPSSDKSAVGFFQTRNMINGFYIHLLSPDRGIIFFTPVILFGVVGFVVALKRKVKFVPVMAAIVGFNLILYSMWGDPWGGWAFGSRYLIPSYAILSIFIALLLTYWRKYFVFLLIFFGFFAYSAGVNTLGAITSSANPPQGEAQALEKISGIKQDYTYLREWNMITNDNSKSFVFQTWAKNYMSAEQYFVVLVDLIILCGLSLIVFLHFFSKEAKDD